jgi:uncharacterized protein (TIGR02246 family)
MSRSFAIQSLGGPRIVGLIAAGTIVVGSFFPAAGHAQPPQQQAIDPGKFLRESAEKKPAAPAVASPELSDAEKAIRGVDEEFVRAYNSRNGKALLALFTDDAEIIDTDGAREAGREAIEKRLALNLTENPQSKMTLDIESIRFIHPDVAKEEGRSIVTEGNGSPVSLRYTALFTKKNGRWLICSIRESDDPGVRPHDRLKALDWLIGDWVDEGSDAEVRVNCRWSDDGNYLLRTFVVKQHGKAVMDVSQRIGWDPVVGQFRSWEFDTEGGFGEGTWSHDGERWIIKRTGVQPEGVTGSATIVMTKQRPDMIRWSVNDRVLGGVTIPGSESFVLVRTPPQPRTRAKGPASTPTAPNAARSPQ